MTELPAPFGKYLLCERIATGGMAAIYLAKLIGPGGFEKQLVIKQIHPQLAAERRFVDLLVAEAKTLVSLGHGNIVPVYERGVVGETYFIAMEYVDGPTLAGLMRGLERAGGAMAPAVAAHVACELCKGLDYAHRKGEGVIHRDLSPRNVLLSRDGEVKLCDFGLAVPADPAERRGGRRADRPAGSFPYMSPEQVRQEPLDGRSDLFSAGVLLWEMLAGQALFAREDEDATLAAVLDADIPAPSAIRSEVPAELDRICLRALERDPAARWRSAGEMAAALARHAVSADPPVTPASLAALIARACPPVPRRATTRPPSSADEAPAGMDRTRPMAGRTIRTFAASEHLAAVLDNATPLLGLPTLPETPVPVPVPASAPATARRPLVLAGLALTAVAIAVLAFTLANRSTPRAALPALDARPPTATDTVPVTDTGTDTVTDTGANATTRTNTVPDPGTGTGTGTGTNATTRTNTVPDPGTGTGTGTGTGDTRPRNRPPAVRGTGTLQVGANPWADVYLDGRKIGQAPGVFPVAAGPHTVELRHRDASRRFRVTIDPDETESLGLVDFTSPPPPPTQEPSP